MMNKFLLILVGTLILSGIFFMSSGADFAFAQDPPSFKTGIDKIKSDLAGADSGLAQDVSAVVILTKVINWLLSLVAILALLALIVGGLMYILSFGNDARTQTAKKILLYAIIGLLVVGISFAVITGIQTFLTEE